MACDLPDPESPVSTMNGAPTRWARALATTRPFSLLRFCRLDFIVFLLVGRRDIITPARLEVAIEPLGQDPRRVVAPGAQELIARGDLDQDRNIAPRRHRHPDERHPQTENLMECIV